MVYVDNAFVARHGYQWCHLLADSVEELHEFAASIGLSARAFHHTARIPHYDVTRSQRRVVLNKGALAVSVREGIRLTQHLAAQRALRVPTHAYQQELFA